MLPGPELSGQRPVGEPELPELVLDLDPGSVAIRLPPAADGDVVLSRFLREISREAGKLATALEARRVKGVRTNHQPARATNARRTGRVFR